MRALVLDAELNAALAVTRSLSEYGFSVTCAGTGRFDKSFYSKHCTRRIIYAAPSLDIHSFINDISKELDSNYYDIVIPISDKTVLPLSIFRNKLPKNTCLALPEHEMLLKTFNKQKTIGIAQEHQIPIPNTHILYSRTDVNQVLEELNFPVVVKANSSTNIADGKVVNTGSSYYANTPVEVIKMIENINNCAFPLLIQEFVSGTGYGVFTLFKDNKPITWFAHKRIRDTNPTGSGSSFRQSIDLIPELKTYSEKLLSAIGWNGVAMVEFKKDENSGLYKLMEVNGRFWNSLPLAIYSGVNFPVLLCQSIAGTKIPEQSPYKINVKCRWVIGDLRHLRKVLKGKPKEFPGQFPKRFSTIKSLIMDFFDENVYYDVLSLNDPMPFIAELFIYLFTKLVK